MPLWAILLLVGGGVVVLAKNKAAVTAKPLVVPTDIVGDAGLSRAPNPANGPPPWAVFAPSPGGTPGEAAVQGPTLIFPRDILTAQAAAAAAATGSAAPSAGYVAPTGGGGGTELGGGGRTFRVL